VGIYDSPGAPTHPEDRPLQFRIDYFRGYQPESGYSPGQGMFEGERTIYLARMSTTGSLNPGSTSPPANVSPSSRICAG
jgi:hypothetical protein